MPQHKDLKRLVRADLPETGENAGTGWPEAGNVLGAGEDAAFVHFGVLLAGAGAVDLAGPRSEVVGTGVPVTWIPYRPLAAEPQGLDFGAA